ncbi:uncharacterized protein [Parasteatoda tepidariorum]|uniref:uncharacterized protein isoform X2 n=1 Tax=Parasteatoda tepidariorum TaxID=114398 RepID=UPI00077FDC58|nr:uncharacterized protein LOC107438557 [Parasteatoda tepidariorum]
MRRRCWFTGAMVCALFAQAMSSLLFENKHKRLLSSMNEEDEGLANSYPTSVSYSVFLSALSGLQRTTQRKRTAMGMDLTDYLWSKAHEKNRALVLQRMLKNGKR